MAEVPKLLYVVVVDGEDGTRSTSSFRYTRPVLQSCLQLMGCKARHAFKMSRRVFEFMRIVESIDDLNEGSINSIRHILSSENGIETGNSVNFELYKRRTTIVILREKFLDVVCDALTQYKYLGPNQRADLVLACRIKERKESVTVLLCGTSGCGKSTLSALLGSRLGVTTVISTDSIRHVKRSFVDEKKSPLLWASTYHAGEFLDPVAVADAKAKRKAKKTTTVGDDDFSSQTNSLELDIASRTGLISEKQMAIEGFKAQSEMVIDSLDQLITAWEDRKESVIVEGVHLSLNFVVGLMKKHPSIIPFMIYIVNEEKHMERFAVRTKHMTLDPSKNKYIKYIRNIRTIQEYLCNRADKHDVPKVNNTNVDRSVATIHATVFSCLRRKEAGEQVYDPITNTVPMVYEEYMKQCAANSLSSKGMLQLIQRKGSFAKARSVNSSESSELVNWNDKYGALQIEKVEQVNLQFGNFGIGAWPTDAGGTSHTTSIDGSATDNGHPDCCSPRTLDGPAKELKKEFSVSGSGSEEEDTEDNPHILEDTDDDLTDFANNGMNDDEEGSVDESTKSDEEYDDLAILDGQDNGYWSDNDDEPCRIQKGSPFYLQSNVNVGGAPAMAINSFSVVQSDAQYY